MTLSPQLLAILVCPKCKGTLTYREGDQGHQGDRVLDCPSCKLRYPVRDDIPIMLVDEATAL
jgi:uncharacterized protein YbaR (Trm112 family)